MKKKLFKSFSGWSTYATYEGHEVAKRFYDYVRNNMSYETYDGIRKYTGNRKYKCVSHLSSEMRFETDKCRYWFGFDGQTVSLNIMQKEV